MHNPAPDAQMVLLDRFCREAKDLITHAASIEEAVRQKDSLCEKFGQECSSQLVINAARNFVDNLVSTQWKKDQRAR